MKKSARKMKVLSTLAAGGMMLQFGGCSLDTFLNQASIGFARGVGAFPVDLVISQLDSLLGGVLPGGDGGTGA